MDIAKRWIRRSVWVGVSWNLELDQSVLLGRHGWHGIFNGRSQYTFLFLSTAQWQEQGRGSYRISNIQELSRIPRFKKGATCVTPNRSTFRMGVSLHRAFNHTFLTITPRCTALRIPQLPPAPVPAPAPAALHTLQTHIIVV
jgi:hypothetical protein